MVSNRPPIAGFPRSAAQFAAESATHTAAPTNPELASSFLFSLYMSSKIVNASRYLHRSPARLMPA